MTTNTELAQRIRDLASILMGLQVEQIEDFSNFYELIDSSVMSRGDKLIMLLIYQAIKDGCLPKYISGTKKNHSCIYIHLPKMTFCESEVFKGQMGKALKAGINVTKREIALALSKENIHVIYC